MTTNFNLEQFLALQDRLHTYYAYKNGIERFTKWFGEQISREIATEDLLQMRKTDLTRRPDEDEIDFQNRAGRFENELVRYHKETMERGVNKNSARTYTTGIIQLFKHYKMPFQFDRSQNKIRKIVKTANSFPLDIKHVQRMYQVADLKERVMLSLAIDLGIRIGDFLTLKIDELPNLDENPPIPFERNTRKEDVPATHFLSGETVDLLKVYLPTLNKSESPYLFPNKEGGHITSIWFNEIIRKIAQKAGIQFNGKKLSSHCFRKLFRSMSMEAGYETAGKKICGVTINPSEDTYYTVANLREPFIEIKKKLTIQSQVREPSDEIKKLNGAIVQQEDELSALKTRFEKLDENYRKLKFITDFMQLSIPSISSLMEGIDKIRNLPLDKQKLAIDELVDLFAKSTSIPEQQKQLRALLESSIIEEEAEDSLKIRELTS